MPIGSQPLQPGGPKPKTQSKTTGLPFDRVLQETIAAGGVKFSAHAERRLQTRGITLDRERLAQLSEAIDRVAAKGGKESLVLMDELALIVSVKNRTVITAIDGQSLKTNVFTNIDSAIIT
ncbi:MAG: hypothetical protein H0Z38_08220 [Firmicutes bacterium]|nr:hypothetical protein [Bacillota bacterium]